MPVDLRKVKKFIELVEESQIAELEVSSGDESVRIVMHRGAPATFQSQPQAAVVTNAPGQLGQNAAAAGETFVAPMAGTFYRRAHPEAPVFVEVGQSVQAGDVLCIIESMKMMHEIRVAKDARIEQICVANGEPISTGEVLFKLS